jgi:hypothetical protein
MANISEDTAVARIMQATRLSYAEALDMLHTAREDGRVRHEMISPSVDLSGGGVSWMDRMYDMRFATRYLFEETDVRKLIRSYLDRHPGGRPPTVDKEEYYDLYRAHCRRAGGDPLSASATEAWVSHRLEDDGCTLGETQLKALARELRKRYLRGDEPIVGN